METTNASLNLESDRYDEYGDDDDDNLSDANSSLEPCGSVVSTVPDKHGFIGGNQYLAGS